MRKVLLLFFVLFSMASSGQVNQQTGSAIFNLPMFDWQDSKSRLNSTVMLSYSSGNGLKVSDVASDAGQGWNIIAGGVITRMQVGEPDDQKPYEGNGTIEDVTKYPPGYLYDTKSAGQGCPEALAKYPVFRDQNHIYKQHNAVAADKEMDQFAYQFNGRSGMFILGKDSDNDGEPLGDSKLKIWYVRDENIGVTQGVRTTIVAFYIQDENGLIYKFSNYELTKVMKVHYTDAKMTEKYTQPEFKGGNVYYEASFDEVTVRPYTINGWYLAEIEDPLTGRKIFFSYVNKTITATVTALSHYKEKDYSIVSRTKSVTQTPTLSAITYPDGHSVLFNYGGARVDLPGADRLASVDVKYEGRFLSKFQFTTSYFIGNRYGQPNSAYQEKLARLCLLSVKKIGVDLKDEETPYVFDYYLGSNGDNLVPAPHFHMKDIWGYYNGLNSQGFDYSVIGLGTPLEELNNTQIKGLCFMRNNTNNIVLNSKDGYAKNGLLKRIVNPAGGTLTYEYSQNFGYIDGVYMQVGGVHVSRTLATDGGYSNDCNNPLVTNYSYTLEGSTTSSLWGLEAPKNSMAITNNYDAKDQYFYWRPILEFGCDWKYKYPGILSREQAVSLTSSQQFWATVSKVLNIVSGVMQIIDIVSVCLKATPAAIVAVIIDFVATLFNIIITCTSDPSKVETINVFYNSDLNSLNPLPAQFKRVQVTEGSGTNGRTVIEFTSPDDYPLWELTNPALSMKQRYAPWAYGLEKKITIFDAAGNKVKETENIYSFSLAKRNLLCLKCPPSTYPPSCKCLVVKSSSQKNEEWADPLVYEATYLTQSTVDILVDIYNYYTGRVEMTTSYERTFKPGSSTDYLETTTLYEYQGQNFQIKSIRTYQSNGDLVSKDFTYNDNYTTGVFDVMKQHNISGVPVTVHHYFYQASSSTNYYSEEKVTEFTIVATGDIKPLRTLVQRFAQPQTSMGYYVEPNHPGNPNYVVTETFYYDVAGNQIGMRDEGNRVLTNIYDYNDKLITASVINADPLLDKSAYTSFETASFGGWTLNGTSGYSGTSTATGVRSFVLSGSNSLSAQLNTAKPYRVSFWASNGVTVSNAALVKSAPTILGLTYYEYEVPQGTASITINGSAIIDELRVYPQTARMRTVTYEPLIGKTSECDENNRITYYEYNNLGKLHLVKDENRNIIKMYEYNEADIKQTSGGCQIVYSNNAITEYFVKNDCPPGMTGTTEVYTIPAGRYTSTISQAVADMMAQHELDTYGQAYANTNGTCVQLYCNTVQSQTFTKQCPIGYTGTSITYTVPACKYYSLVSQEDANAMALYEIKANGQAYANLPGNASCTVNTTPVWILTGNERCEGGHRFVEVKDENPNSSSFGQLQWVDKGTDPTCPPYSFVQQNPPCSGSNASYTLHGVAGDVVVLKLTLSGVLSWTGSNNGTGATISLSGGGQSCSNSTSHITAMGSVGYNTECTITFTMPSNAVTINTTATIHNTSITGSSSATIRIMSVNGATDYTQIAACLGVSSGNW